MLNLEGIFNIFTLFQCQKIDTAFSPESITSLDLDLPQDVESM